MISLALKSLGARKFRAALTSIAIVLGVTMVSGTYVLTDTIDSSFEEIFTEANEGVDAVISTNEAVEQDDGTTPPFNASILDEVERVRGVGIASGTIADAGTAIIGADGEPRGGNGAPSLGFSAGGPDRFDPLTYVEGGPPEGPNEVTIDKASADDEGFEIGDQVTISGKEEAKAYTLVGIATLGDIDSFGGATFAVIDLPEIQRITGKVGQFDQIIVAADEKTRPEQLAQSLTAVLPDTLKAETGLENVQSQQDDIGELTGFLKIALLIFGGVALFVAAFLIFNTFSIIVAQRTREFAMLRTLGASRRQIVGSVTIEALVMGLLASIIGVVAGIGFAEGVSSLLAAVGIDLPSSGLVFKPRTVILGLALGTAITVVSALFPALRATRVPPITGLREGAVLETTRGRGRRTAAGGAMTVLGGAAMLLGVFGAISPGELWIGVGAGLVFIGVTLLSPQLVTPMASFVGRPLERLRGTPGKIARENTIRNPGRTATTAAALMIGLALVSFVSVFAAGIRGSIDDAIDQTLAGDLILSHTDGFTDIPVRAGEAISDIDGIQAVSPYRYTQAIVENTGSDGGYLSLINPGTAADVLTLDWTDGSPELLRSMGPNDAVADEGWADEHGFGVGDSFDTTTASGEVIPYTITGTFKDNTDFIGDYAASDENAQAYGEGTSATNIFVNLAEGADVGAVRGQIDEVLSGGFQTIETLDQGELKDSIGEQLDALLGIIYALLMLTVIVSLFGIVNTLALSIHERTRELGLLRAVGTSRRQVRRIVRYEAVITALIGAVLGAILGVVFAVMISRPLADEGFTLSIPVGTLIMLLLLSVVAGVIAAIGPARRASKLDVLEALSYE